MTAPTPLRPLRAAILSIGDELVLGQTLDTNSRWLSQRLLDHAVTVTQHITLPDDLPAIVATLRRLTGSRTPDGSAAPSGPVARGAAAPPDAVDLIIITGGLGPTADDLTRDALASLLSEPLIDDQSAVEHLRRWFAGRDMPRANLVQARRPSSATGLPNPHGTALGLFAACDPSHTTVAVAGAGAIADSTRQPTNRDAPDAPARAHPPRVESPTPVGGPSGPPHPARVLIFCLPGPPREMQPMFDAQVLPRLARTDAPSITTRVLPCFGLGESEIARRLGDLMDRDRAARNLPLVGTTASQGVVSIRIRATGDPAAAARAADETEDLCRRLVGDDWIIARGETSLAACVLDLLRARRHTLAVAESCTAGLLGSIITDIPGSSDAFVGGWITYANEMKIHQLGVPEAVIAQHGAVSRPCAIAMAQGALQRSNAHHALAITGIAGPDGGTEAKPVGTVWIALASRPDRSIPTASHPAAPPSASSRPASPAAPSSPAGEATLAAASGSDRKVASASGFDTTIARRFQLQGDRTNIRAWAAQSALGLLRLRLISREHLTLMREVPS